MKYMAIIDADEKPVSCEFIGCNGNVAPYMIGATTNIKALEQKPKWIPVDYDRYHETYPKAFQEVWVTDGYGEVYHKAYDGTRSIKAWMPYIIPEPYKAEGEDKK